LDWSVDLSPHYRYVVAEWPFIRPYLADDFDKPNARDFLQEAIAHAAAFANAAQRGNGRVLKRWHDGSKLRRFTSEGAAEKHVPGVEETHRLVVNDLEPVLAKMRPPPVRMKQPQFRNGIAALAVATLKEGPPSIWRGAAKPPVDRSHRVAPTSIPAATAIAAWWRIEAQRETRSGSSKIAMISLIGRKGHLRLFSSVRLTPY
jgi:hypothetical protein